MPDQFDDPQLEPQFSESTFRLRDGRECVIRSVVEADAAQICEMIPTTHVESDFLAWLPGEFQMTVAEEVEFLRNEWRTGSVIVCADLAGRIIATAGARKQKFRRFAHQAEFGITVTRSHWGQGLGRKLTECLLEWGRKVGLRKMTLRVYEDNVRAIALYRSLGFVEEGMLRQDVLRQDGRYTDSLLMAYHYRG